MALADEANRYVDEKAPWVAAKDESRRAELHETCTTALNLYRILIGYIMPILPELAERSMEFLNVKLTWQNLGDRLYGTEIKPFKALFSRIDKKQVDAMLADSLKDLQASGQAPKDDDKKAQAKKEAKKAAPAEAPAEITIDDFAKVDMRAAKVLVCEEVPESKKIAPL